MNVGCPRVPRRSPLQYEVTILRRLIEDRIEARMRKLPEVEEAKNLMLEAQDWSVFTWLFEKRRVRETADRANAALDKLNRSVKARWGDELKVVAKQVAANRRSSGQSEIDSGSVGPELRAFVERVKAADEIARHARATAESTFDEAERGLDTELAREGCRQAIRSWELHETAIRKAESIPTSIRAAV